MSRYFGRQKQSFLLCIYAGMEELGWMVGVHLSPEDTAKWLLIFDPLFLFTYLSKLWLRVRCQASIGYGGKETADEVLSQSQSLHVLRAS